MLIYTELVIKLSYIPNILSHTLSVICYSCSVKIFNSGIELNWNAEKSDHRYSPLLKREASGERLTHRSFQKLNSLLFCNFTRLCLSIRMIPAFDLYSLIVPLTTHQPNQPSWSFLGEKPSKIWRFRNSTPGFFEPVRDCSFISQCKFGVPRDPFHPICNIVINWDDPPPSPNIIL